MLTLNFVKTMKRQDYFRMIAMFAAVFAMAFVSACSDKDEPEPEPTPEVPEEPTPGPVEPEEPKQPGLDVSAWEGEALAVTYFAYDMFKDLLEYEDNQMHLQPNLAVSPLSVSMLMSWQANATSGLTRKQIMDAIGYGAANVTDVNSFNKYLLDNLSGVDASVKVNMGMGLWADNRIKHNLNFSFLEDMDSVYGCTPAYSVKWEEDNIRNLMGAWASDRTGGLLTEGLPSYSTTEGMAMILGTAFNMNGGWYHKFDKSLTFKGDFTNADGTVSNVEYMKHEWYRCVHWWSSECTFVMLPYGKDWSYNVYMIVPNDGVSMEECISRLPDEWMLYEKIDYFAFTVPELVIPKFTLSSAVAVEDVIKEMGAGMCFSPEGDLSNLFAEKPLDSFNFENVVLANAASFSVDESGFDGKELGITDPDGQLSPVHINRPFLVVVTERYSNIPVLMGRVTKL